MYVCMYYIYIYEEALLRVLELVPIRYTCACASTFICICVQQALALVPRMLAHQPHRLALHVVRGRHPLRLGVEDDATRRRPLHLDETEQKRLLERLNAVSAAHNAGEEVADT